MYVIGLLNRRIIHNLIQLNF